MVINVSVQCNGGFLPEIILLTLCGNIGEPFSYHVEFLSLQPRLLPNPFDCSGDLAAFVFFVIKHQYSSNVQQPKALVIFDEIL